MNVTRANAGRWLLGTSGNPRGRPVGAQDKHQRTRTSAPQPWAAANLGIHAILGGPGKTRGNAYWEAWSKDLIEAERLVRKLKATSGDPAVVREFNRVMVRLGR